ncbi:hypothetical protein MRB53_011463 [Persea americana]|uniref:Uncharacterized protein n=1 Tax=Persea americana TaxID=3435 RepID=A0ACC2LUN7_PERAE|nr:hypothetical protein MRB53_011463 [Persea americana]
MEERENAGEMGNPKEHVWANGERRNEQASTEKKKEMRHKMVVKRGGRATDAAKAKIEKDTLRDMIFPSVLPDPGFVDWRSPTTADCMLKP